MNRKDLSSWLFQNSLEDQWWLAFNGSTQSQPLTLDEIENLIELESPIEMLSQGNRLSLKVLHVSQEALQNPPWIDLEILKTPTPQRSEVETRTREVKQIKPVGKPKAGGSEIFFAYFLSILLPIFGILAGFVLLSKGQKEHGTNVIVVSILMMFLAYFFAPRLFSLG